jgi:hypothetical protein
VRVVALRHEGAGGYRTVHGVRGMRVVALGHEGAGAAGQCMVWVRDGSVRQSD